MECDHDYKYDYLTGMEMCQKCRHLLPFMTCGRAVQEERERCIKIVETWLHEETFYRDAITKDIRGDDI